MPSEYAELFFTKEQIQTLENLGIKERVQLARFVLWSTMYDKNELKETTPEGMSMFLKGATAMFDYASMSSANHYHGDPRIDKVCQDENNYLMEVMEYALQEVNPEQMCKWVEINDLFKKINELEKEISRLKN